MAKSDKRKTSAKRAGGGHVVVVCPQCGKRVKVPGQLGMGQMAYPCPSCRVPITRSVIEAATASDEAASPTVEDAEI